MTSFLLFMLRVFINTRGWRFKKSPQSELRRQEGALLREKLIKLGPTFIKTGQSLATRADLLPVEYIQELAKPILRHRIMTNFYAESERITSDTIVERLLETVPVPKSGM